MNCLKKIILILSLIFTFGESYSQVGISNTAGFTPDLNAILDISSTTKGLLIPRMNSSERNAISTPAQGLLVFDTQTKTFCYFDGANWKEIVGRPYYPSVTICNQSWMTKNLDVSTYRNGDEIPYVTDHLQWLSLTSGAWCYYDNNPANAIYGKLYNWYAVNDPRGLAPEGWHVPTDFEYSTLVGCLGGNSVAGGALKEIGTAHWNTPNTGATNISGFTALPGGTHEIGGPYNFYALRQGGFLWSSTETNSDDSWIYSLGNNAASISRSSNNKKIGFSVRCIRD